MSCPAWPQSGLPSDWQEYNDPSTGRAYYYNKLTKETTWDKPAPAAPKAPSVPAAPVAPDADWTEHKDPATGKAYYYNKLTKETTWEKPATRPGSSMPPAPAAPKAPSVPGAPVAPGGLPPDWTEHKDPATGKPYYYNKLTKETTWDKPATRPGSSMPSAPAAPNAPSVPGAPIAPGGLPSDWTEHKDPATGKAYYYNKLTKETTWDKPAPAAPKAPSVPAAPAAPGGLPLDWTEHKDPATGKAYYYNKITKETTWDKPATRPGPSMPSAPAAPKAPSVPGAPIAPGGLSPEWTEHKDPATGKAYYYNKITKETSWQRPPGKSGASPILLLAFDFDCTISSLHLFEHLYRRGGVDIPSQISVLQQQCYEDPNFTALLSGPASEPPKEVGDHHHRLRPRGGSGLGTSGSSGFLL